MELALWLIAVGVWVFIVLYLLWDFYKYTRYQIHNIDKLSALHSITHALRDLIEELQCQRTKKKTMEK